MSNQEAARASNDTEAFLDRMRKFGPEDVDAALPPVFWPRLSSPEAAEHWPRLVAFVDDMRERYEWLDAKVLPRCWYRHHSYVAAMQALFDYQRVAYSDDAPGSAGVDWHRAMRDIEAIMSRWTSAPVTCEKDKHKERTVKPTEEWLDVARRDVSSRPRDEYRHRRPRGYDRSDVDDFDEQERELLVAAGVISGEDEVNDNAN